MRLTKIYLVIGLVILSTFFASNVLAENEKPEATTNKVTLAQVNIQDVKIISQKENTLEISFNLNNRDGAQSGVRYGVKLIESVGGRLKTVEEYVYPEVLSLAENTTTEKTISYTPSFSIKGEYEVVVSARNYSGLLLGAFNLGKVVFTEQPKTIEIISETCSTSIERANKSAVDKNTQTILVSAGDKISLSCIVKNNLSEQVSVTPRYETYIKTLYGEKITGLPESKDVISLRPLEERNFVFAIPRSELPQSYLTMVSVGNEKIQSNSIQMSYTVSGLSATIQNVSLDKNSYKANETAKIAFFWTSSATNREELTSISLKADIVNKNKRSCIESPINTQMAGVGFIEIPVTISKSCDDPEVTISLYDASGKVLDQKALIFEANEETNLFSGKLGIIAIVIIVLLVLAGLILYFKNLKDKDGDDKPKSGHIEGAVLAIFFVLSVLLVPWGEVKADTIYVSPSGTSGVYPGDTSQGVMVLNFNLDKSTYSPGEYITLETTASYIFNGYDCSNINLSAAPSSTWSSEQIDFNGETIICPDWEYGATTNLYTGASAGSYYVSITGTVYLRGIYAADVGWQMPFSVSSPASVTVWATNVNTGATSSGSISITSGTPVKIFWTTNNASGRTFYCSPSCGSSTGNVQEYWTGNYYYPSSTTTYFVSDD